jgi:threonine dehydrogenase-like Zn-dependent dehydrogenase
VPERARAVVLVEPERLELRLLPVPEVGPDTALVRIESSGVCGTDLDFYHGHIAPGPAQPTDFRYPLVLGHEPVGVVEQIGPVAARRWGVDVGDRVTANYYTCGVCESCRQGREDRCIDVVAGFGRTCLDVWPALWGSWAEYLYLPPMARVARFTRPLPASTAALYNAFGGAWAWSVERSGLEPGQSVAILGPGQRGLAAIVATKDAGAGLVAVVGRGRHPYKLDLARMLGADVVVNSDLEDPVAAVAEATGGGVDVVVDLAPDPATFALAVALARRGGVVVAAASKRGRPVTAWCPDPILDKGLTVIGAYGQSDRAKREGIRLVECGDYPVDRLVTHTFPLERAAEALATLEGADPTAAAMNVVLVPRAA